MSYEYRGSKSGEADPWAAPKPEPKPKPVKRVPQRTRKTLTPCGTKSAHKRHIYKGEKPCEPCKAAKREYDRMWRAGISPSAQEEAA